MITSLKKIYWKWLEKSSTNLPSNTHTFSIAKKNETWPFDLILCFLKTGKVIKNNAFKRIDKVRLQMLGELSGKKRNTSYRHQWIEMDCGECAQHVSSPEKGGKLCYKIIKLYKPNSVVEIGSAFGVGSMYICQALKENGFGFLKGIEYEPWRADIANLNLKKHWSDQGIIYAGRCEDLLLELFTLENKINFAFIDAVHKYDNCMEYHSLLKKTVSEGAIALFDDINWSDDMRRYWKDLIMDNSISDALLIDERWGLVRYNSANTSKNK